MIWINGRYDDLRHQIAYDDRGFLLGEGVFETIAFRNNDICHWSHHWARLNRALHYIGISCHYSEDEILSAIKVCAENNLIESASGTIRITVSAGGGGRGLSPAQTGPAQWLVQVSPISEIKDTITLEEVDILRPSKNPSSRFKTLSYIDNIMARRQISADEAILFNEFDRLACAAAGNVFILQDDCLITPPCSDGALDGIIRQVLLERGTIKGLACQEATISRSQLRSCDALFVTNSLIGAQAAQSLSLKNEPPIKKGSPRDAEILLEIRSFAF